MGALCSLVGPLGDKIEGLNEHLAAKFVGEQARGFVGRCSPSFMGPYLEFSTISSEFKGHQINEHKRIQANQVGLLLTTSLGQPRSRILLEGRRIR